MEEYSDYYGFRGNLSFIDQVSIFNIGLENNSKTKNKIFKDFFETLKENKKMESEYQKRMYYLIFIQDYGEIYHCQLARKRQYDKFEMTPKGVVGTKDQDYPYVNIFIEIKSQKFLIQSNTKIFENYNTCKDVIQNIMNNNLKYKDINIIIEPIIKEEEFWKIIENEEITSLQFMMCTPNMFDADDDANNLLKDIEKNMNANHVNMHFSNNNGKLQLNRRGIDSFIKYISAGAGKWKVRAKKGGKKSVTYSSEQKSQKVHLKLPKNKIDSELLEKEDINKIREEFLKIETIEKFKGE